jgi:hypothetical protein
LQRDERCQSFARCAAARILSRSFARASAPSGPRSITSRRPPSCSTTSRIVWRGTPGRMSRSAVQVRTRSHWIRRPCSDQGRCHRRLRRPALTTPVKVSPKSSRSLARTTSEYQRRQAEAATLAASARQATRVSTWSRPSDLLLAAVLAASSREAADRRIAVPTGASRGFLRDILRSLSELPQ